MNVRRDTDSADPRPWPCVVQTAQGVVLDLSVVPGAKRTECVGLHGGALRVRLAAPPVDGKANEALLRWLSESLGQPRRSITLLRGLSSRRKQVLLAMPLAAVCSWLDASLPPSHG